MPQDWITADIRFDLIDRFQLNCIVCDLMLNLVMNGALCFYLNIPFLSHSLLLNNFLNIVCLVLIDLASEILEICYLRTVYFRPCLIDCSQLNELFLLSIGIRDHTMSKVGYDHIPFHTQKYGAFGFCSCIC